MELLELGTCGCLRLLGGYPGNLPSTAALLLLSTVTTTATTTPTATATTTATAKLLRNIMGAGFFTFF